MVVGWIAQTGRDFEWTGGVDALLGLPGRSFRPSLDVLLSFLDPSDTAAIEILQRGLCLDAPLSLRLLRRDGSLRHARLSLCDNLPGCPDARIVSVEDREPALQREATALVAQRLGVALGEHMLDGLLLLDRDGRVSHANDKARRDLPRDPVGRILWELYPSAVGGRFWKHVREVMESGVVVEDEHLAPDLGGWVGYRLAPFADGVMCVCRRLDEVHHLRTLLQDLTERVDLACEGGNMALWQLDLRSDRIWVSDGPGDLLGAGQMTRKTLLDRIAEEDRDPVDRAIAAAIQTRRPFETDFRCLAGVPGGGLLRMRGAYVPSSSGRPDRLVGIVLDLGKDACGERAGDAATTAQSARDLTGAQVRAARGLLRWSVRELSEQSRVSVATINRIETSDGVPSARSPNLVALHAALSRAGARILMTADREPAIALLARAQSDSVPLPAQAAEERTAA